MTQNILYLNGEFLPVDEAKISVLDRGFIFGDGVYEVIPVYGGNLFRLDEHIKRLENSLVQIRIPPPLSTEKWYEILSELVRRNGGGDLSIYLQITRGVAPRDHAFPPGISPTIMAMANPLQPVASELLSHGVGAITMDDFRWQYCDIKAIALLANILARQEALDSNAAEAIFIRNGLVTEGAASNVFIVKNREIITPAKTQHLLPGITRDLILELAVENRIPCSEGDITIEEMQKADEIWLTSSTREIVPVTKLNGSSVGNGNPGPLWSRLLALYQDNKRHFRNQGENAA
jgi:D-alanine transaminase